MLVERVICEIIAEAISRKYPVYSHSYTLLSCTVPANCKPGAQSAVTTALFSRILSDLL